MIKICKNIFLAAGLLLNTAVFVLGTDVLPSDQDNRKTAPHTTTPLLPREANKEMMKQELIQSIQKRLEDGAKHDVMIDLPFDNEPFKAKEFSKRAEEFSSCCCCTIQ
jgi:hypothetical protein